MKPAPVQLEPLEERKHASSAAAAAPPAAAAAAAAPLSEMKSGGKDNQELAARLHELQQANQLKLSQLERQLQRAAGGAAGAAGLGRFVTPARGTRPAAAGSAAPRSAAAHQSFAHPDPSSPFASSWTPSGLTSRAAGSLQASPDTPFQQFHTPYTATAVSAQGNGATEAIPFGAHGGLHSASVTPAGPSRRGVPIPAIVPSAHAAAAASDGDAASAPAVVMNGGNSAASGSISSAELDELLSELNSKHAAQVAHFQAAEQRWHAQLQHLQQQREQMQQQIDGRPTGNAGHGAAVAVPGAPLASAASASRAISSANSDDESSAAAPVAASVTVSVQPGSLLHSVTRFTEVALPVAALAYGVFQVAAVVRRHTSGR